ncbi:MAG TPA: hypothetical protein VFR27_12285, partial [Mycobacterium sp.]|nr:hypothetical protein [Mycobacterium sp.]
MRLLRSRRRNGPADTDPVNVPDETPVIEACTEVDESAQQDRPPEPRRRLRPANVIAYGVLPALLLLLAAAAGLLKWQDGSVRNAQVPAAESVRAATDGTIALLSYKPDTVETDLEAARGRLTGQFLDAYTSLTHDVVIPGAKQKKISAVASVP